MLFECPVKILQVTVAAAYGNILDGIFLKEEETLCLAHAAVDDILIDRVSGCLPESFGHGAGSTEKFLRNVLQREALSVVLIYIADNLFYVLGI